MADLSAITALNVFIYGALPGQQPPQLPPGWSQLPQNNLPGGNVPAHGFLAQAFQNNGTGEIVVVIRGTANPTNYETDAGLTVHLSTDVARDAIRYAMNVEALYPKSVMTLTGHSMGGYAAQAAYANLVTVTANHAPALSAVTFNAPGLPSSLAHGLGPGAIPVYNFNTIADWVHLYGGSQIGHSTSIAIGPTVPQEWTTALQGFDGSPTYGVPTGVVGSFLPLASSVICSPSSAHTISQFAGYFGPGGAPTYAGGQTAQLFFQNNEGVAPDPNLTFNSLTGAVSLGDGAGNRLVYLSGANGTATGSLVVGNGAGLTGSGTVAGLQASAAADGSVTFPDSLLGQASSSVLGATTTYRINSPRKRNAARESVRQSWLHKQFDATRKIGSMTCYFKAADSTNVCFQGDAEFGSEGLTLIFRHYHTHRFALIQADNVTSRYGLIHVHWQTWTSDVATAPNIDAAIWELIDKWNLLSNAAATYPDHVEGRCRS